MNMRLSLVVLNSGGNMIYTDHIDLRLGGNMKLSVARTLLMLLLIKGISRVTTVDFTTARVTKVSTVVLGYYYCPLSLMLPSLKAVNTILGVAWYKGNLLKGKFVSFREIHDLNFRGSFDFIRLYDEVRSRTCGNTIYTNHIDLRLGRNILGVAWYKGNLLKGKFVSFREIHDLNFKGSFDFIRLYDEVRYKKVCFVIITNRKIVGNYRFDETKETSGNMIYTDHIDLRLGGNV
ncbi:hypothetical protein Tco_1167203 [Tanacetum coccineum]